MTEGPLHDPVVRTTLKVLLTILAALVTVIVLIVLVWFLTALGLTVAGALVLIAAVGIVWVLVRTPRAR